MYPIDIYPTYNMYRPIDIYPTYNMYRLISTLLSNTLRMYIYAIKSANQSSCFAATEQLTL